MARKKEPERVAINQDKISHKASELFRTKGYEATRMEEIAREVEMSKATLYSYFKNKEEIKNYLSLQAMQAFYDELCIVKRFQKEDVHDHYLQICDALVRLKEQYPDEFSLIVQNICVDPAILEHDTLLKDIYETGEQINQVLFSFFEDVLPNNEEGIRTIFSQWGSLYGLITLAYNKEAYIEQGLHITKGEFLQRGFEDLFRVFIA